MLAGAVVTAERPRSPLVMGTIAPWFFQLRVCSCVCMLLRKNYLFVNQALSVWSVWRLMLTSGRDTPALWGVTSHPAISPSSCHPLLSSQLVFAPLFLSLFFSFSDLPFSSFQLSTHFQGFLLLPFFYSLSYVRKGIINAARWGVTWLSASHRPTPTPLKLTGGRGNRHLS